MAAREKSRRSISRPLRLEGYLSGAKLGKKRYFVCSCGLVFSLHRFNDRQPKNDFHTIIRVLEEEIREGVLHLKVKWSGSTSNGSALYPDTWMPPIAKVYVSLFIVDVLNQLFQLRTPDEGMVSQFRIRRAALAQHRECGHVRLTSAYEGGLQFLCISKSLASIIPALKAEFCFSLFSALQVTLSSKAKNPRYDCGQRFEHKVWMSSVDVIVGLFPDWARRRVNLRQFVYFI